MVRWVLIITFTLIAVAPFAWILLKAPLRWVNLLAWLWFVTWFPANYAVGIRVIYGHWPKWR